MDGAGMSARESRILSEIEADLRADRRLDRHLSTMRPGRERSEVWRPPRVFVIVWMVLSTALLIAAWTLPWAIVAYTATWPITCALALRWLWTKTARDR
jgi:hypothetical protein